MLVLCILAFHCHLKSYFAVKIVAEQFGSSLCVMLDGENEL